MTPETIAELQRRHAALTPFVLRFLSNGPGGEFPYVALACEDGTPLPEPAFDAVLLFAELAAAELPALLDGASDRDILIGSVNHYKAERDALAAKVERALALHPRDDDMCCNCGQPHPCDTRRALDKEAQP